MTTVSDVLDFLEGFAPPELAESWDNVGLLCGDRAAEVTSVLCATGRDRGCNRGSQSSAALSWLLRIIRRFLHRSVA